MAAAGVVLLRARATYPRDVATAAASQEEMRAATDQAAGATGDTAPGTDVARSGTGAVVPGGATPAEREDDADEGPTMVM